MPKYLALTPQQAAEVKQFGAEPSEYVYEVDTGEAVPKAEVPMTLTEQIGAGLKSFVPGVTDTILAAPTLVGQAGDLVRQVQGTYDPYDRSHFTQGTQAIKDYIVDTVGAPDPRAHWLSTGIGRGAGNLLSFIAGGGLASKATKFAMRKAAEEATRKAAERAAKYTVAGLGGTLMGSSTIEREMDRQQDVGVQDPLKTAVKGLVSGIGGGYIEQKLGSGLLLRNLMSPTKRLGSRLGQAILPGFAGGASTEGLQQGLENELVTEGSLQLGDPQYDPVRAAIVGGIVQGVSALALSGSRKPAAPPQEGAEPGAQAAEQASGIDRLRTGRVRSTSADEDTQGAPTYEPTPGLAEAMIKAGKNWDEPIKTPVGAAFKKLAEKDVIVTPEDIHSLYNIWGGKAENAKAVEAAANDIYARNVMNDVQKPKSALDVINAELAVRGKYNETRGNLQAELAKLDKKDADLQKTIAENPAAMGTITAANAELQRNAAQRKNYEAMLGELDNQEMLELSANQPVLPTKGMAIPATGVSVGAGEVALQRTGRPSVEVSDNSVVITPAPPGPTKPKVAPRGTADPAVQETLQGYAEEAGTLGLSVPMDPARAKTLQEMREQQEGEQGSPFGESPQTRYSGVPPEMTKWVGDLFKSLGLKNLGNFDPAYAMSKSVTSRLATRGPSGGLVKWLFTKLQNEKYKLANTMMEATEPFREFINSENGIKWINRASTDETWDDYSGLRKEEIPVAQAYGQFWSDLRDLITDRGVYVMEIDPATGKVTPRPGKKLPGYTPWAVGDHIYEMAGDKSREAEWKKAQEDFVEKWKEKFGEGSEKMAREAIANLLGVKGMETGPGGEPLFGPVSLPHGMTLPESWRDPRPADSLNRYIRRVSQHLAWSEVVQYNPAARRVFNIKADPMGNPTAKTDPTTWAEAPDAWAYAVREGKRVRAKWAMGLDENTPPDEPIDFAGDSASMNALLSSFKQASSPNPNLQAFSSAASAALMQAPTGLRDVGMSLVRAAQYAGPSAALRASMDYIANIPAKLAEARQAGAMPGDLLEPEIVANSKAIARGLMKAARKMRSWSGREFLDNTGRVIIYDAVKSVILEGNGDHLVREFGPAFGEGLTKEQIAEQTAAILSHRASNVSDAGSLPAGMLPQSGGALAVPLSLMRWSVAQYNTFAEDVVNPMLDGKGKEGMKRFLTLTLGSIVAGSVINGLLDDLLKRKPDHLTWGEWLNVYNDPKVDKATKAKEFAYAAASRAQVMGALGWVGDYLVAPAAREIAGGTRWANQTDIQYPAWIVGNQMAQTIGSYYNAVSNKRTDGRDFLDFLLEMGKINQNVRVAHGAIKAMQGEEKKGLRNQGVVERVYGVNSSTGRPAALETGMGPVFRSDPFNFTRQAMGNEDLGKFEGFLEARRRTGNVPSLDTWSQDRRYYKALERLVGEEEAKKRREVDRRMDQEVRKKNREIRRLSR